MLITRFLTPCIYAAFLGLTGLSLAESKKPNIILLFADDISAREIPIYNSSHWSPPTHGNSQDEKFRATTPVMDRLAEEGVWVKDAWSAVVCKPSRAMIMSGRFAHIQKWWNNRDVGKAYDEEGKLGLWPVYESSPITLATVTGEQGYRTYWTGKSHLAGDQMRFGFDEACHTPAELSEVSFPYTDFKITTEKRDGKRVMINQDTGEIVETYAQNSWYWRPEVQLLNDPSAPGKAVWWPNTPEALADYGLHTYGPDVEQDFAFNFMERAVADDKPFFIFHASHLGHDGFNWFDPSAESKWPSTPKIHWDGKAYSREEPKITGDNGSYDTHDSITELGLHHHINYLDYQLWRYREKLQDLGVDDNTIIIFTADNGTGGYGKNSSIQQKGCHVPFIFYAPGMTKKGQQNILVTIADILPTLAELSGYQIPEDYEVNGKSLVPYLFTDEEEHRDWIYCYRGPEQIIRSHNVLRDGRHRWWDVSETPGDLTSFAEIKNFDALSPEIRKEVAMLQKVLPRFDKYDAEHDAPGVPPQPPIKAKGARYFRGKKK